MNDTYVPPARLPVRVWSSGSRGRGTRALHPASWVEWIFGGLFGHVVSLLEQQVTAAKSSERDAAFRCTSLSTRFPVLLLSLSSGMCGRVKLLWWRFFFSETVVDHVSSCSKPIAPPYRALPCPFEVSRGENRGPLRRSRRSIRARAGREDQRAQAIGGGRGCGGGTAEHGGGGGSRYPGDSSPTSAARSVCDGFARAGRAAVAMGEWVLDPGGAGAGVVLGHNRAA